MLDSFDGGMKDMGLKEVVNNDKVSLTGTFKGLKQSDVKANAQGRMLSVSIANRQGGESSSSSESVSAPRELDASKVKVTIKKDTLTVEAPMKPESEEERAERHKSNEQLSAMSSENNDFAS